MKGPMNTVALLDYIGMETEKKSNFFNSERLGLRVWQKKFNCRLNKYLLLETLQVSTNYGRRAFAQFWYALPLETN